MTGRSGGDRRGDQDQGAASFSRMISAAVNRVISTNSRVRRSFSPAIAVVARTTTGPIIVAAWTPTIRRKALCATSSMTTFETCPFPQ